MIELTDQTGNHLSFQTSPGRIVSLVPSLTETLIEIGLGSIISGRTKFCIHPKSDIQQIPLIGGTKNPRIQSILQIKPDIIIANKEENRQEDILNLAQHIPVYVSDIKNTDDLLGFLDDMQIIFPQSGALTLKQRIEDCFRIPEPECNIRACYMIWKDPWMTVGNDTFIHHMMEKAGFTNVFGEYVRYPEIDADTVRQKGTEVVLLSSEPYPFRKIHAEALQNLLPDVKIMLVDGEIFSWYGSRVLKAPAYFERLRQAILD